MLFVYLFQAWEENSMKRKHCKEFFDGEMKFSRFVMRRREKFCVCHLLSDSVSVSKNLLFVSCFWNVRKYNIWMPFFTRMIFISCVWYPVETRKRERSQTNNQTRFKFVFGIIRWISKRSSITLKCCWRGAGGGWEWRRNKQYLAVEFQVEFHEKTHFYHSILYNGCHFKLNNTILDPSCSPFIENINTRLNCNRP